MTISTSCLRYAIYTVLGLALITTPARSGDWARFRGPNGTGVSVDQQAVPTTWSETENLNWSVDLPGLGLSCPIVVGDRIFLTCWTGYGTSIEDPGDQANLLRHVLCLDRNSGKTIWSQPIQPVLPEDEYGGMFAQHGYASHTPVSDGERVYVFLGKTGALAFDLDGNQLWQMGLGEGSGAMHWGTSSSPVVYNDLAIFTAAAESQSIVALDKLTGEEKWRFEDESLKATWSTPVLVIARSGREELAIAVPSKMLGIDPANGELLWECRTAGTDSNSACASTFSHDGIVYSVEGRNGGAVAVRAGGSGDVTETHMIWRKQAQARIGTPVYYDGHIYWFGSGIANCIHAETGDKVFQERLEQPKSDKDATEEIASSDEHGQGRRRGGRGGNWARSMDYASPVAGDGKLYFPTRGGDIYVIALKPEFEQLAVNRFTSDMENYCATPAISDGEIFIRSEKRLYCVSAEN